MKDEKIELDLTKKVQDIVNSICESALKGLPPGFIRPELLILLKDIMAKTYYLGFRQAINVNMKHNEILLEVLPKEIR